MVASYEPPPSPYVLHLTVTTASTSGLIVFPVNMNAATNLPTLEDPPMSPEEMRQTQLAVWSREAILEASKTLRTDDGDPTGLMPQRPRGEPSPSLHDNPRFRRRVCAGSSRYRVLRA